MRKKIFGIDKRPRLNVSRSLRNLSVQIIDDSKGATLVSASTLDKDFKKMFTYGGNTKAAGMLGEVLAKKAKEKGIAKVVFDRGSHIYHGRIRAFAEGARKAGLEF
jgi:large subunit ribosomal protein L18